MNVSTSGWFYPFPINHVPSAQTIYCLNAILQRPECRLILERLEKELPNYMHYHSIHHTLDVCQRAEQLAIQEGVSSADIRCLLVAAAYHDCGYILQDEDHEKVSCDIAKEVLRDYNYSTEDLQTICSIIMATQLPQTPHNLLGKIICDADLDYLGRNDFFENGHKLYQELQQRGIVKDEEEWNEQQVHFLENHYYFTATAIRERQAQKEVHLSILKQKRSTL